MDSQYKEKAASATDTVYPVNYKARVSLSINATLETEPCVELLQKNDNINEEELENIYSDCNEVIKILTAKIKR